MTHRSYRFIVRAIGTGILCGPAWGQVSLTWTGSGVAPKLYSDPANWTPAGPPHIPDSVTFRTADTIVFNSSPEVHDAFFVDLTVHGMVVTMNQSGNQTWRSTFLAVGEVANLTLNGLDIDGFDLFISQNGTLTINSGSLAKFDGIITTYSPEEFDPGMIQVNSGGTLSAAAASIGHGVLGPGAGSSDGTLVFNGGAGTINTVSVGESNGQSPRGSITLQGGSVVNQDTGRLTLGSSDDDGQGTLSLHGAGTVYHFNGLDAKSIIVGGDTSSTGKLLIDTGALLQVGESSTLAVNKMGTLSVNGGGISSDGVIDIFGGNFLVSGGSGGSITAKSILIGNSGSFSVTGGDFTLSSGATLQIGDLSKMNSTGAINAGISNTGTLITVSGGTMTANAASTWGSGTTGLARGTFGGVENANSDLNIGVNSGGASFTINSGTLIIGGNNGLTVGGGTGTQLAQLTATGASSHIVLPSGSSTTVNSRGSLTLLNGASYFNVGSLTVDGGNFNGNAGTYSFTYAAAPYTLAIKNSGSFQGTDLTTTGTPNFQITAGGKFLLSGALNVGVGTVNVTGANSQFAANTAAFTRTNVSIGNLGQASFSSLSFPGSALGGTTLNLSNGTLIATSAIDVGNSTTFNASGTGIFPGILTNTGTINILAGSFSVASTTTNNGRITFDSQGVDASFANINGTGTFTSNGQANATFNYLRQGKADIEGITRFTSRSNGGNTGVSRVGQLVFDDLDTADECFWDLNDNALIVDYTSNSPASDILSDIVHAYDSGAWDASGLTSSTAAANHRLAIGYAENSALHYTTFGGQPVDNTTILVKTTYMGDANLDGKVDSHDLSLLALHWQQKGGWSSGDFNYDGRVDILDVYDLALNWNADLGSSFINTLQASNLPVLGIPEPNAIASFVMGLWALKRSRRRA